MKQEQLKIWKMLPSILLMVLLASCIDDGGTDNPPPKDSDSCAGKICKNYGNEMPRGMLDGETIQLLSRNYAADKGKAFVDYEVNQSSIPDALSVTFSLEEIKKMIWQMEYKACKSGCSSKQPLGLKFYFIKYPDLKDPASVSESLRDLPVSYSGKHSIVMVPAYEQNDIWYDYDPDYLGEDCAFKPLKPGSGLAGKGLNHGGIAPPPDPSTFPTNP